MSHHHRPTTLAILGADTVVEAAAGVPVLPLSTAPRKTPVGYGGAAARESA